MNHQILACSTGGPVTQFESHGCRPSLWEHTLANDSKKLSQKCEYNLYQWQQWYERDKKALKLHSFFILYTISQKKPTKHEKWFQQYK